MMDAGTAIEHTAICQLRGRAFGPSFMKRVYTPMPITQEDRRKLETMERQGKRMIKELKPGEKVESYFSVAYKKPVIEYRYGNMFEFRAADRTGQITVKYWGDDDKAYVQKLHESFDRDDVVSLSGEVSDYRGQVEISVSKKNGGSIAVLAEDKYDVSSLIPTIDGIEELKTRLFTIVLQVEEPHMRELLQSFFQEPSFMKEFSACPASIQLHSAAFGGLLHHTLNVTETCIHLTRQHPELDRDLVITGALLHDIGKVRSFKTTTHINQTHEGNLLGHIAIGDEELVSHISRIDEFPNDLRMKLRHVLLSHHGKKEWGSPVDPMMPEALVVHEADDTDAKIDYMVSRRRDAQTEDDWIWDHRLGRLVYLK